MSAPLSVPLLLGWVGADGRRVLEEVPLHGILNRIRELTAQGATLALVTDRDLNEPDDAVPSEVQP